MPNSILITGASSGIGAALALHYAATGVHLALTARNAARLEEIARRCREMGATVQAMALDVTDEAGMAAWVAEIDTAAPLDLVIANAGISEPQRSLDGFAGKTLKMFAVNVSGVFHTVHPVLRRMCDRQYGQIALMSSVAGYHGLPSSPAYSASKAAIKAYGEALHGFCAPYGVKVSVICPGFVESRMTADNAFSMPFLLTAPHAARTIADGLHRNAPHITFPFPYLLTARLMLLFPERLVAALLKRSPRK